MKYNFDFPHVAGGITTEAYRSDNGLLILNSTESAIKSNSQAFRRFNKQKDRSARRRIKPIKIIPVHIDCKLGIKCTEVTNYKIEFQL